MKKILFILLLIPSFCFSQYEIRSMSFPSANDNVDTTFLKTGTDSLFKHIDNVYVFSHRQRMIYIQPSTFGGIPIGGTTGQVLTKTNSSNYAFQWATPSGGGGGYDGNPATIIQDATHRFVTDATFSGTNTGDESNATIKSKLGITTLSGSNTGDQDLSGLCVKANNLSDLTNTTTARSNLGLVIGTNVLAPNGSAASLTSFPTLNQNTSGSSASCTGNAATVTTNANLNGPVTSVGNATTVTAGAITNTMLAGSIAASKLVGTDIVLPQSQITNLTADLALKSALASPTFTGTPTLPTGSIAVTQTAGNSTTAIATTAFVTTADNLKQATLVSATNIKTINGASVLGSGDLVVNGTGLGYTIHVQALTSSPTDAQTIYFGDLPRAPTTTAATSKVYIRKAGTIKIANIYCYSGTAGTAEAWPVSIRLNNTTDTQIASLTLATSERIYSNTSLNIPVIVGDYIEIKAVNPTWVTNPLTTIFGGYIYIE